MKKDLNTTFNLQPSTSHTTVLLHETVDGLALKKNATAIDATVGTGGHTALLAEAVGKKGVVMAIDADELSLTLSRERLKGVDAKILFIQGNFRNLKELATEAGITEADGIAFDLGWHTEQLQSGRGLSFKEDEPLLMTLSSSGEGITAKDIIADWDEEEIAKIIREYGEERFSGRIARVIVEHRDKKEIQTARELADIIASAVPGFYRRGRINPATRTFQALRIAVNDELGALTVALSSALELLSPGGRVAVISFHSLEDRIVKHAFHNAEKEGKGKRITKKPIIPSDEERKNNPRARSAKLRIFEKKT